MQNGISKWVKITLAVGVCAVALAVWLVVTFSGNRPPAYSIKNGDFSISTDFGETIKLAAIKKVELKNSLPGNLSRTNGYGLGSIVRGQCSSDIGNVTVYLDTSVTPYIYLATKSGTVILNNQTAGKTKALYHRLAAAVPQT